MFAAKLALQPLKNQRVQQARHPRYSPHAETGQRIGRRFVSSTEEGSPALSSHSIGLPFPAAAPPTKTSRLYVALLSPIDDEGTRAKVSNEPEAHALLQLLFRADPAVYCVEGHRHFKLTAA